MLLLILILPGLAQAELACAVLSSDIRPYKEAMEGFKQSFNGKVEEQVLIEDLARAGEIMEAIKKSSCNVVVAMGSNALKFLKLREQHKPIVFAMTLSPATEGLEGRNITGVFLDASPRAALLSIKRILPSAAKVGVLYSGSGDGYYMNEAKQAAAGVGITLVAVPSATTGDAIRNVSSVMERSDVLLMIPDQVTSSEGVFEAMLAASLKRGVPIFALSQKHVSEGALAALSTDYKDNGRQAAEMANRIASGAAPSSMPYAPARKSGIVINLKAAKRMGIVIPSQVVAEAVEVYR